MRKNTILIVISIILGAVALKWWADKTVDPGEVLGEVAFWAESDTLKNLTVEQVARFSEDRYSIQEPCCNIGLRRNAVWLRFRIENTAPREGKQAADDYLVEVINPTIPDLSFYVLSPDGHTDTSFVTGARFPHHQRPRILPKSWPRNFIFPVQVPRNQSVWCYLRVQSSYPLSLRVLVFDRAERLHNQQRDEDILLTIFYVVCLVFSILGIILISFSKEYFHWYYLGYILLTTLFIPAHLGIGFKVLWPNHPEWQFVVPPVLNMLRIACGIQFFRIYFDLKRTDARLYRVTGVAIVLLLFMSLVQLVHRQFGDRLAIGWVHYLFFGFLLLFSAIMLGWLINGLIRGKGRLFYPVYVVISLNLIGLAGIAQQYTGLRWLHLLGFDWLEVDISDKLLATFGVANTFFLWPFVMLAFFLEILVVFYMSNKRYLRLLERGARAQAKLATAKEQGLNALILGVENERKRIARELHDGACVNLAAIDLRLDALREELSDRPEAADKLGALTKDLGQTYRELRDISHDLMSKTLEKTGLQTALEELAGRLRKAQPGLDVNLFINYPLEDIGQLTRIHVYRIVQELTGNILKHAQATRVDIQLLDLEGHLSLTIEDNGKGFDTTCAFDGIGLSNVRTRAEVLRGKMILESAPGKNTFVSIEIPGITE